MEARTARASARADSPRRWAKAIEADAGVRTVAVLGLGYVGLPTGLALHSAGFGVVGIDRSEQRLDAIRGREADLLAVDAARLDEALADGRFRLTSEQPALAAADAVLICVPTPVDSHCRPDLEPLRGACATVVDRVRPGQTVILTSTSYVGTTREMLVEPLERCGLEVGRDVHVVFSPERIDPGNEDHHPESVPRVVGPVTAECAERAATVLGPIAPELHVVSSPEAAELTKLQENTFRAVNIALANEISELCGNYGLDPIEVTEAAATKPYGFMPFYPGAGVGGHCIPCDPHYLLRPRGEDRADAPLIELAMGEIGRRPGRVVDHAEHLLERAGTGLAPSHVLVVGAAYKLGVRDVRESPGLRIMHELRERGAEVDYHDPLVESVVLGDGARLDVVREPADEDYDLVVIACADRGSDYEWLDGDSPVLDSTGRVAEPPAAILA